MITIDGVITSVMETWPLQLTVTAGSKRYLVSLTDKTAIRKAGRSAEASALVPNVRVTILGHRSASAPAGGDTLIAEAITLSERSA